MKNHRYNKAKSDIKESFRMSKEEKRKLDSRLFDAIKIQGPIDPIESPYVKLSRITVLLRREIVYIVALFVIVILGGGSTIVSAERAVPGDFLYPIKIGITETVRSGLTIGKNAKAGLEVWKTGRRLAEAEVLAVYGKLDSITRTELSRLIDVSEESFYAVSNTMEEGGFIREAQAAQEQYDIQLSVHDRILLMLQNHIDESQAKEIEELRNSIKSRNDETATTTVIKSIADQISYTATKLRVESLINRAESIIGQNYEYSSDLQKSIIDETKKLLTSAKKSLEEASKLESSGKLNDAVGFMILSKRAAEESYLSLRNIFLLRSEK